MTRTEFIDRMAMIGRTAFVGVSNPETYWADLDDNSKNHERRQAEAVLDLLTKEAETDVWVHTSGVTSEGISGMDTIHGRSPADLRTLADELEKEACDAADES